MFHNSKGENITKCGILRAPQVSFLAKFKATANELGQKLTGSYYKR